jgi:hypothetical protein
VCAVAGGGTLLSEDLTFHDPSADTTTKAANLDRWGTAMVTGPADIVFQSEGLVPNGSVRADRPRWRMLAQSTMIRAVHEDPLRASEFRPNIWDAGP